MAKGVRLTIEFVRSEFEAIKYRLLTDKYENVNTRLVYVCDKNHPEQTTTWKDFKRGQRCPVCSFDRQRLSLDSIRDDFLREGLILTATEYKNSKQNLSFICRENQHKDEMSVDSFRNGRRCIHCSGRVKVTIDRIASELEKIDWTLHSTEYNGPHEKLKMKCPVSDHPMLDISWSDFYHEGTRCKYCSKKSTKKERSQEESESIRITNAMRIDLCKHLGREYPFVTKVFCGKLALQIIEKLGPRPSSEHHIDHIISPSWFNHNNEEQRLLCWNINNVRWLLGGLNSSKYNYLPEDLIADLTPYQICVANLAEWRSVEHEDLMRKNGIWMSKQTALERLSRLGEEESLIAYKIISGDRDIPKQA